jgi:hypothetical protein
VGDIDFEVISISENSNKFQKTRFWEEKSVEDMVTLGPMAQATLVVIMLNLLMNKMELDKKKL